MTSREELQSAINDLAAALAEAAESGKKSELERTLERLAYLRLDEPIRPYVYEPKELWDARQHRRRPVTTIYLPGDEP